jgi:hypothetical protein
MSQIFVEARRVDGNTNFAHSYLSFIDDFGNKFITSLDDASLEKSIWHRTWDLKWNITQVGKPWEDSVEYKQEVARGDQAFEGVATKLLDLGGRRAEDVWKVITDLAHQFQHQDLPYELVKTNSNAFVSALMHAVGIDYVNTLPDFLPGVQDIVEEHGHKYNIPHWFDAHINAAGHKFTGVYGLTSAEANIVVPWPFHDKEYAPEHQSINGIFKFDFTLEGTQENDVIRSEVVMIF